MLRKRVAVLAARYWLLTIAALVVAALFSGAAYAAVLDLREAEQMTLGTGAAISGSHVILNATGERVTWVDGGATGGTSVTATARHNGKGTSRVGLALYVNGVNRGSQFWDRSVTANAERTWTGLNLSDGDDLEFRAVEVGSREAVLFDRARVDGTVTEPPAADSDGDGVPDSSDWCPGFPDSADADGDGAPDACDAQDNRDSDTDGVQNYQDQCPNEAGPASNNGCPAADPYPGLRYVPLVGYQPFENVDITPAYVDAKYQELMKPAYHGTTNEVKFAVRKNVIWSEMLVDPTTMPTHAQMRDHTWSGYRWNQPGQDDVADALQASCVQQGKCKISFQLKVAQGGINNPQATPQFMLDAGLAWIGDSDKARIKFHNAEARRWVADFYVAAFNRYGNNPNIGSIKLAEYWPGPIKPADWNRVGYENGYQAVLEETMATVERDANGNRVVVYQSNPILSPESFTCSELIAMKVGQAAADPQMFEEAADRKGCIRQADGVVPQSLAGDVPYHERGYQTTYDGTPNPWGYTNGQKVAVTLPQVFWFYGHAGPGPMDEEAIVKGTLDARFQEAMDQFGPGGTLRAQWGGVPFER